MRRGVAAALALALLAGTALGQGYTRDDVDGLWQERPVGAVPLDGTRTRVVPVPFPMRYFGEPLDALTVSPHAWAVPGDRSDLAADAVGDRDGVLAAWDTGAPASGVWTWTDGEPGRRRLVVQWERDGDGLAQLQLWESGARICLAYHATPRTGAEAPAEVRARLDEPRGDRFVLPLPDGIGGLPRSTVFTPRTVLFNPPGIGREGVPVRWQDVRKESTVPDGCTKRCTYLARGRGYFHVPDRALFAYSGSGLRKQPPDVLEGLLAEDRATFGGEAGDATRWVRQVLDGKVLLLPADGGEPLRLWFRIVEYFSLDDRGTTLADHHVWNLRWLLSNAFPGDDPREDVNRYFAWRAAARGRLSVGKLLAASQTADTGKQYDSGRKNEYVLWSGRLRTGTRGALAPGATPGDGWVRFTLLEDDLRVPQRADAEDVRFVPDPHYVDGAYEYVIEALDNPFGWVTGREVPRPPLRDEGLDDDPGRTSGPVTPR